MQKTVSVEKVTPVLSITEKIQRTRTLAQPEPDLTESSTSNEARNSQGDRIEYVVEHIVKYIEKGDELRYVV